MRMNIGVVWSVDSLENGFYVTRWVFSARKRAIAAAKERVRCFGGKLNVDVAVFRYDLDAKEAPTKEMLK